MWLFNRTGHRANLRPLQLVFSVLCGLVLAGCSDLSVRQLGDHNQEVLRQIAVAPTDGREGQLYRRELQKLLYIGGQLPENYELTSSISISAPSGLSVQGAISTLKKMSMTTSFALRRLADGKTLLADSVTADATLGTEHRFMDRINLKFTLGNASPFYWHSVLFAGYSFIFLNRADNGQRLRDEGCAPPNFQLFNKTTCRH